MLPAGDAHHTPGPTLSHTPQSLDLVYFHPNTYFSISLPTRERKNPAKFTKCSRNPSDVSETYWIIIIRRRRRKHFGNDYCYANAKTMFILNGFCPTQPRHHHRPATATANPGRGPNGRAPHTAHRTRHTPHRTRHTAHRTRHTAHGTPHAALTAGLGLPAPRAAEQPPPAQRRPGAPRGEQPAGQRGRTPLLPRGLPAPGRAPPVGPLHGDPLSSSLPPFGLSRGPHRPRRPFKKPRAAPTAVPHPACAAAALGGRQVALCCGR